MDVPAGVTQEEGNTGFSIHLLSAVCSYRVMNVRGSYLRIRVNTSWTNHVRACGEV